MWVRQNFWRLSRGVFVILFVVFSLATLAERVPERRPTDPPPDLLGPVGVPCIERNGIIICDPDLIAIIIRYNLEVLPAPPPGIKPLVVESLAELESILAQIAPAATVKEVGEPITGPYDPGTQIYDPGEGALPSPPLPPPPPPEDQESSTGSSGSTTSPTQPREAWVQWELTHWVFPPYLIFRLSADVYYYPGDRFTAIYERVELYGSAFPWSSRLEDAWSYAHVRPDGKYVQIWGGGTVVVWFGLKDTPFCLEYRIPVKLGMGRPVPER